MFSLLFPSKNGKKHKQYIVTRNSYRPVVLEVKKSDRSREGIRAFLRPFPFQLSTRRDFPLLVERVRLVIP
jgi:hypothetical protein